MATVDLHGLWLNDAADPTDSAVFRLAPGWSDPDELPGEVRRYGARIRSYTGTGVARSLDVTLRFLTAVQVEDLRRRRGRLQWVRTSTGLRMAGQFWAVKPVRVTSAGGHLAVVQLSITGITATDALPNA